MTRWRLTDVRHHPNGCSFVEFRRLSVATAIPFSRTLMVDRRGVTARWTGGVREVAKGALQRRRKAAAHQAIAYVGLMGGVAGFPEQEDL